MTKTMKPYTCAWEQLANEIAREIAPVIWPCTKCGYPVPSGFNCGNCGEFFPEPMEEESTGKSFDYDLCCERIR